MIPHDELEPTGRPYPPREILSYHVNANGTYRAVIVRWHRDRYTRVHGEVWVTYTAPTVRGLWDQLYHHGHIPSASWRDDGAYYTFARLGRREPYIELKDLQISQSGNQGQEVPNE